MREAAFKRRQVEQARIGTGDRVLDLGCDPATLTLLVKQSTPAPALSGSTAAPTSSALPGRRPRAPA